jgi:hypothetical protein
LVRAANEADRMQRNDLRLDRRARLTACLAVIAATMSLGCFGHAAAAEPRLFQFESQALEHCPSDTVVWVNPKTGIYVFSRDQRWYGKTRPGSYVCQREGKTAGYRATKKG